MRRIWAALCLAAVISFAAVISCAAGTIRGQAYAGEAYVGSAESSEGKYVGGENYNGYVREDPDEWSLEDEKSEILSQLGLDEIETYLRQTAGETEFPGFQETMEKLMEGRVRELVRDMLKAVQSTLFSEISSGGKLAGQVLILGILTAVFSNFSMVFQSSQISETGFFVTYLLLFALLTSGLAAGMAVAAETVSAILGFMRALMPAYFLAVACSGAAVSAAAMYETTMLVMAVGQWLLQEGLIPLVRAYLILAMAGNMMKENVFSRLSELLGQIIGWGIKTLLGVVVGIQLLQTLVLPYVDSLKSGSLQRLAGMIPGIGQGMSAVTQMILGSGVLIKNTMGMAAVMILAALTLIPVVKLFILMLLYQWMAAVMEPVCDKRILACVSAAAAGHRLLLKIVMTAAFLLILTVAVVCAGTNAVYYA